MENNCIKHAVELEQSFMEGAYNRVLSARQTVPHETCVYFMDLLAKTVRDEIAGCSEKAYDSLSINDARKILLFSSDKELFEYVKETYRSLTRGLYGVSWEISKGLQPSTDAWQPAAMAMDPRDMGIVNISKVTRPNGWLQFKFKFWREAQLERVE
ncbi:hypothetical protein ACSBR1_038912 [Camellia fascicularis]